MQEPSSLGEPTETGSIIKDLRELMQDIVAPEVKALAAEMRGVRGEVESLRREMEVRDERIFNAMETRDERLFNPIERASLRGTIDLQRDLSEFAGAGDAPRSSAQKREMNESPL